MISLLPLLPNLPIVLPSSPNTPPSLGNAVSQARANTAWNLQRRKQSPLNMPLFYTPVAFLKRAHM